jgi:hypothetical protein
LRPIWIPGNLPRGFLQQFRPIVFEQDARRAKLVAGRRGVKARGIVSPT